MTNSDDSPDYRALFESAPGLYLVLTPQLTIVGASDAYLRQTMTSREDVVGRPLFEVFPDNPAESGATGVSNLSASLDRVLRLKRPDAMAIQKYDVRRPDGVFEERYWSPLNSPVLGPDGEVRWIIHRVEDVTELVHHGRQKIESDAFTREQRVIIDQLRRANEALAENQARLEEREAHLRSVLSTVPDGIIIIDEMGIVESFSPAAARMFGYEPEEVLGRNVSLLMPSPYREEHDAHMARYRETGKKRIIGVSRVLVARRRDGSTFPIELAVGEAWTGERRIFTGFVHDVTERQGRERRLQELQSELAHASRISAMGQMASALAHELNQPLAAIASYMRAAERILEAGAKDSVAEARQLLSKASTQSIRAGQIIQRLRAFIEKGRTERTQERLYKVVEEALALGLVGVAQENVKIRTNLQADLPPILVDKVQIQQVLINLIRNAVDAMRSENTRELTVTTKPGEPGFVEVSVSDTGSGLPSDVEDQLFRPFVTTKDKGMGLGLTICQTIVEAHGGRIWMERNDGAGTTFRFRLPVVAIAEDDARAAD